MKLLIAVFLFIMTLTVQALPNDGKVPVLLYHSWSNNEPCDYSNSNVAALEHDLLTLRDHGYTVVPLYWIVQWRLGVRDGSTLPRKVVAITFDDGHDFDWLDNVDPSHPCAPLKSFRTVLQEFKDAYADELPWYSPHAAAFVIASPVARAHIEPRFMNDNWWPEANASGLIEVYNHSSDHDHPSITRGVYDPALNVDLVAGGHADGNFTGQHRPERINNLKSNDVYFAAAAQYIASRISAWPDLVAYPLGRASSYTINEYMPKGRGHGAVAAFCGDSRVSPYVTRQSPRYCLPRLTFGNSWTTHEGLVSILKGAEK